jgi:hypothetical protein
MSNKEISMNPHSYNEVLADLETEKSRAEIELQNLKSELDIKTSELKSIEQTIVLLRSRINSVSSESLETENPLKNDVEFSLIDQIRGYMYNRPNRSFTYANVFDYLRKHFPDDVPETRRRSVKSTVNNLRLQGELTKVKDGLFVFEGH